MFKFFILAKFHTQKEMLGETSVTQSTIDYRDPSESQKGIFGFIQHFGFFVWNYDHSVLDISHN